MYMYCGVQSDFNSGGGGGSAAAAGGDGGMTCLVTLQQ